jgi:hypothetical protein
VKRVLHVSVNLDPGDGLEVGHIVASLVQGALDGADAGVWTGRTGDVASFWIERVDA